jgi:hypothetical protein
MSLKHIVDSSHHTSCVDISLITPCTSRIYCSLSIALKFSSQSGQHVLVLTHSTAVGLLNYRTPSTSTCLGPCVCVIRATYTGLQDCCLKLAQLSDNIQTAHIIKEVAAVN